MRIVTKITTRIKINKTFLKETFNGVFYILFHITIIIWFQLKRRWKLERKLYILLNINFLNWRCNRMKEFSISFNFVFSLIGISLLHEHLFRNYDVSFIFKTYSTRHIFWYSLMLIPSIPLLADPYGCFACLSWCWLSWCWSWLKVGQCWLYTD